MPMSQDTIHTLALVLQKSRLTQPRVIHYPLPSIELALLETSRPIIRPNKPSTELKISMTKILTNLPTKVSTQKKETRPPP